MLYGDVKEQADGCPDGAGSLDKHTGTQLESTLLSAAGDSSGPAGTNHFRLVNIAYDREDCAINQGINNEAAVGNGWNTINGPVVCNKVTDRCTEINRPTGVVTWIGNGSYADKTAFPPILGYNNGSCVQSGVPNGSQVFIPPTMDTRKAEGNVGNGATMYHLRFFDPKYILNKAESNQETKFELRYYIRDRFGKGYERNANLYIGGDGMKVDIMDNTN